MNYLAINAACFLMGVGASHIMRNWLGIKNAWVGIPLSSGIALCIAMGAGLISFGE